jgi:hypothetical protein
MCFFKAILLKSKELQEIFNSQFRLLLIDIWFKSRHENTRKRTISLTKVKTKSTKCYKIQGTKIHEIAGVRGLLNTTQKKSFKKRVFLRIPN